jgi:hypothetical protein
MLVAASAPDMDRRCRRLSAASHAAAAPLPAPEPAGARLAPPEGDRASEALLASMKAAELAAVPASPSLLPPRSAASSPPSSADRYASLSSCLRQQGKSRAEG